MRLITFVLVLLIFASCQSGNKKNKSDENKVEVLEVLDGGTYTYLKLKEGDAEFWAAINARPVEIGKTYYYYKSMMMYDFTSKTLDMKFDSIMFIEYFNESPFQNMLSSMEHEPAEHTTTEQNELISIDAPEGVLSIADTYKDAAGLNGKKVKVKGEVMKINKNIMKRNWIHIQDGTNHDGFYDLTITTTDEIFFDVGDVVSFEGILAKDKDFGSGYSYALIIEEAHILKDL